MRGSRWAFVLVLAAACTPSGGTTPTPPPATGGADTGEQAAGPKREPLGETALITRESESPVIDFRIVFDAGSAADPDGKEGLTNLTASLMAQGGAGDWSFAEITEKLYPMAGRIDVHVGRDQTAFVGRVHRDHLEDFYAILRAMLSDPKLGEGDYERVKAQVLSALTLELRGNDDEELGKEALQASMYGDHPYGHPVLGTESGLGAIELSDVRDHRERVFCGGRATVGLAGDLPEGFAERVNKGVAELSFDACQGRMGLPAPAEVEAPRVLLVDKPEAKSVAISMGLHTGVTRAHEDYPALVLAAAYFGQHRQFVGRLMQEMRGERGLNYGDYAYIEHFEQQGWSRFPRANISRRQQYFSMWIRPVNVDQAHFATRMAVRELHRFVEKGLTPDDFERVRTFVDRYYALYLQTESRRLGFAIDGRFYGTEEPWLERLRGAWKRMTVEDVNAAIRRHIDPSGLQIALVHPDAEAFADTLASDEPSPIEYDAEVPDEVLAEDEEIVGYEIGIPRDRMTITPVSSMFE
ncbi:MAG: M16 family metallopeptidase [Polyangiales bacterium]